MRTKKKVIIRRKLLHQNYWRKITKWEILKENYKRIIKRKLLDENY